MNLRAGHGSTPDRGKTNSQQSTDFAIPELIIFCRIRSHTGAGLGLGGGVGVGFDYNFDMKASVHS